MSSSIKPAAITLESDEESDNSEADDSSIPEQDIFQEQQQIFMRFSTKGFNKINRLKFENYLKRFYDSMAKKTENLRKILKMEQMYTRLNKNIAKKQAIVNLLNKAIAEDKQTLQQLGTYYIKKLKRYRLKPCRHHDKDEYLMDVDELYPNRPLEEALLTKKKAVISQPATTPAALFSQNASNSVTTSLSDKTPHQDEELLPGHLMYLLSISAFICPLCINKCTGSEIYILKCCRQHLCEKCYMKCKPNSCPFCKHPIIKVINFFTKIAPSPYRQFFHHRLNEHTDCVGQADDFDDLTEMYSESVANAFAKQHLYEMAMHYVFVHN